MYMKDHVMHTTKCCLIIIIIIIIIVIIMFYKDVQNEVNENNATINQSNFLRGYQ